MARVTQATVIKGFLAQRRKQLEDSIESLHAEKNYTAAAIAAIRHDEVHRLYERVERYLAGDATALL